MSEQPAANKPRACTNCARAKAKCVWPSTQDNGENKCRRCDANGLTCSKSPSVSTKKRGKATHSRVLEQKLDDIMTLLRQDRERTAHAGLPDRLPALSTHYPTRIGSIAISSEVRYSFQEVDAVLKEYMDVMLPHFPFVPLSSIDACHLYKDKPLLLETILWTCRPPGPAASSDFENRFRQHIAHQTVVLMNKSLELIQAILVFLAWKDIYFFASAESTSLLQLAIGLVVDLGLDKSRQTTNPSGSIVEDAAQLRNEDSPLQEQSNDSRRAVLGVYYLTSMISCLFGRQHGLEYVPHLDSCCSQLLRDQQYPTDTLLVMLVRSQKIAIRVNNGFGETPNDMDGMLSSDMHSIAVASIQTELRALMSHLPDDLKQNYLINIHFAAVRIRLFESYTRRTNEDMAAYVPVKYQSMWDCLESTRMLCKAFLQVPIEAYPYLAFTSITYLALAIIKSCRLLGAEDGAWDLCTARTIYDLSGTLQQLSKSFEAASALDDHRCRTILHGKPMFSDYAEAYRGIERWYLSKLNPAVSQENLRAAELDTTFEMAHDESLEFWNQLLNWTDENNISN